MSSDNYETYLTISNHDAHNRPGNFSHRIRGLREFGILDRMYKQGVAHAADCMKPTSTLSDSRRALDLGDFYGVLCIYATGMILACLGFFVEILLDRSAKSGTQQ